MGRVGLWRRKRGVVKIAEIYEASEALYYWAGSLKGDFPDVADELNKIAKHLDQTAEAANSTLTVIPGAGVFDFS